MLFQPEERGCRDKKNALRVPALCLHYVKVSHIRSTIIVENLSGKQHRTKNFHLRDLGMCHRPDHRESIAATERGRGHNAGCGDVGGRPRGEVRPSGQPPSCGEGSGGRAAACTCSREVGVQLPRPRQGIPGKKPDCN